METLTSSYWDLLPLEIQTYILELKESQERLEFLEEKRRIENYWNRQMSTEGEFGNTYFYLYEEAPIEIEYKISDLLNMKNKIRRRLDFENLVEKRLKETGEYISKLNNCCFDHCSKMRRFYDDLMYLLEKYDLLRS